MGPWFSFQYKKVVDTEECEELVYRALELLNAFEKQRSVADLIVKELSRHVPDYQKEKQALWPVTLLVAASVCLIAGCVERSTSGNAIIYRFPLWLLGGSRTRRLGLDWYLLDRAEKRLENLRGYGSGSVLVIAVGVPMMRSNRVEVDGQGFKSSHGLPWAQVEHNIRFDSLQEIRIKVTEIPSGATWRDN